MRHDEVKNAAPVVAAAVASRRMPPWLPAPGRGRFAGERRLSDDEIATIQRWVATGAARGDPEVPRPAPGEANGWPLGEPDLVISLPEPYAVPGDGPEVFRNFVITVPISRTRYVEAVAFRPGNPRVVHHATIMVDATPSSRRLDALDSAPGFDGMHWVGNARMPEGFFLGWTPGRVPLREPEGLAWRLDPGTDLVLQLHIRPGSDREVIVPELGLYFADGPPAQTPTVISLGSTNIDLPADMKDVIITDSYVLPVDVHVLGVYPHAHYLAREIQAFARLPDGTVEWLLHIPDWDFNWQDAYRYAEPVFLPRGATVVMRYSYDNSIDNPRAPRRPPRHVTYGPRSTDEMGDLWIQVLARDTTDLEVLRRDFTRKELQRALALLGYRLRHDARDGDAHSGLGNLLLTMGKVEQAIDHYRRALEIRADDGNTHYNLALALQSQGDLPGALRHYQEATRLMPSHVEAHNNLGNVLVSLGRADEAVRQYRRAIEFNAGYADAHHNLGVVLADLGLRTEALEHYREAARLYAAAGRSDRAAASVAAAARLAGVNVR